MLDLDLTHEVSHSLCLLKVAILCRSFSALPGRGSGQCTLTADHWQRHDDAATIMDVVLPAQAASQSISSYPPVARSSAAMAAANPAQYQCDHLSA